MDEEELLELLLGFLPETWEGWLALAVTAAAILSLLLPKPDETCHPALRFGHRLVCLLGMGAGKLRAAGRLGRAGSLGKLAGLFRRKK